MNYWHMQLHPGEFGEWEKKDIKKILSYSLIGCSGDPVNEFYKISKSDIILVRHGGEIMALVQAKESPRETLQAEKNQYVWFDSCLKIDVLDYYENLKVSGNGWYLPKTLMHIDVGNKIAMPFITSLYSDYKNIKMETEIITLLKYKHQIILQGAPGTGKTRKAMEIAAELIRPKTITINDITAMIHVGQIINSSTNYSKYTVISVNNNIVEVKTEKDTEYKAPFNEIIKAYAIKLWQGGIEKGNDSYYAAIAKSIFENFGDIENSEQVKLIQFHPAYTYEDFVRGISAKSNGSAIEYATEDKVLITFANAALENYLASKKDLSTLSKELWLEQIFEEFKDMIEDELDKNKKYPLTNSAYIEQVDSEAFKYSGDNWGTKFRLPFKEILKIYNKNIRERKQLKKTEEVSGGARQHATYYFNLLSKFREFIADRKFEESKQSLVEEKSFVLIIDEINRANLPAVLGELIYALEYRGKAVESMYEKDESRFITLPPNLYIIGTMNTADRSVGHIDYAIRRRFAFIDLEASIEVIDEVVKDPTVSKAARKLFMDVSKLFEDGIIAPDFEPKDVQIGHSYFLAETLETLKLKLEHEIKPILMEYVKDGVLLANAKEIILTLNV